MRNAKIIRADGETSPMLKTLYQAAVRWQRDDAALLAAAVAYYLAMSLFPILLILTSGLGAFFKWTHSGHDAHEYILQVISDQVAPALATSIQESLGHIENGSTFSGPIGMLFLLFAALAIFAQFEQAFDRMWNVATPQHTSKRVALQRILTHRLRAFAMLCSMGLLLIVVFVIGVTVAALEQRLNSLSADWMWWSLRMALQIGINTLAFASLFRFLPKAPVRWSDALRGGLLTAVIWEVGLQIISRFVLGQHYSSAYGVIGCFLAVMIWGYYAVAVIFYGAEIVQVLGEEIRVQKTPTDANVVSSRTRVRLRRRTDERRPDRPHHRLGLGMDLMCVAALIYVGSFLGLRHFRGREVVHAAAVAVDGTTATAALQPQVLLVRFSDHPTVNRAARCVFAPLIKTLPGPYEYVPSSSYPSGRRSAYNAELPNR